MAEIIKMPRMSDTMEEGNIVAWHKKEGDKVTPGDLLAEIETDKATMDFESLWEGTLLHIAVKDGVVPVEGLIAVIGKPGEDWQSQIGAGEKTASNGQVKSPEPAPTPAPVAEAASAGAPVATAPAPAGGEGRLKASPLAKSIAKESGIDISAVQGSGDGGRIVRRDVEAALENKGAAPAATPASPAAAMPAFNIAGGEAYEETAGRPPDRDHRARPSPAG